MFTQFTHLQELNSVRHANGSRILQVGAPIAGQGLQPKEFDKFSEQIEEIKM